MKNILIIAAFVLGGKMGNAQTIQVRSDHATFSTGSQPALLTTVYQNPKDEVISQWKNYLKDFKNEKVKLDHDELIGHNMVISEFGDKVLDIYTRFEEDKDNHSVKMFVAFNFGGVYLSSGTDATTYASAERILRNFAFNTTRLPISEKIKTAQKLFTAMNGDQKKLEKENTDLHNDIETYRNKITRAEEAIKKNVADQDKKKSEIIAQNAALEQLKNDLEGVK